VTGSAWNVKQPESQTRGEAQATFPDAGPGEARRDLPLAKLRKQRSEVNLLEQEWPVGSHGVGPGKVVERTPDDGILKRAA
jgi:hypothetical protein